MDGPGWPLEAQFGCNLLTPMDLLTRIDLRGERRGEEVGVGEGAQTLGSACFGLQLPTCLVE